MKYLLLSIIASVSFTCFGAAHNLQIVVEDTEDTEDREVLPYVTTITSVDPHNPLSRMIKVRTNEQSVLRYDIAFKELETGFLSGATHRMAACLIADTNLQEGKPAQQLLEMLSPLQLRAYYTGADQYARIKETVSAPSAFSRYKWTVVFVLERISHSDNAIYLYMRILNETTKHWGALKNALYCKLNSTGNASISYDESGMSEEILKDIGGLAPDELGFEIDHAEIYKQFPPSNCIIL